jgi:hypothetical protein
MPERNSLSGKEFARPESDFWNKSSAYNGEVLSASAER